MKPTRVLAGAVALGLAMAAGFHFTQHRPTLPPPPEPVRSPPMDIADANARAALEHLRVVAGSRGGRPAP